MKNYADKFYIFMEHENKLHQVLLNENDKKLFRSMLNMLAKPINVIQKPLGELVQEQDYDTPN